MTVKYRFEFWPPDVSKKKEMLEIQTIVYIIKSYSIKNLIDNFFSEPGKSPAKYQC